MVADVSVDFIAIGEEIHISWPTVDPHAQGGSQIAFGVDTNGDDLGVESIDELRIAEGFLFEHAAGRAIVTVEVDEDRFPGVRSAPHGKFKVFFPLNFILGVAGHGLMKKF